MKKVLIITYYWPPSGGAGVQRWLKFIKYLPDFGWQPIVFTVKDGEYPVLDNGLEKEVPKEIEVHKIPAWEPYGIYKSLAGKKKSEGTISYKGKKEQRCWDIHGNTQNCFKGD